MSNMPKPELVEIGRKAASQLADTGAELLSVRSADNMAGDPSYFFDFRIRATPDIKDSVITRLELSHVIRDELIHRGDETYPYIWITSGSGELTRVD